MFIDQSGVSIAGKTNFGYPAGTVIMFTGAVATEGWLLCDGSEYNSIEYEDLFFVIDTLYGSGVGSFKVPDLRSRQVMGYDDSNTNFDVMGETGGTETHLLTENEMRGHYHTADLSGVYISESGGHYHRTSISNAWTFVPSSYYNQDLHDRWGFEPTLQNVVFPPLGNHSHYVDFPSISTDSKGNDSTYSVLHPYVTVNYIIKY